MRLHYGICRITIRAGALCLLLAIAAAAETLTFNAQIGSEVRTCVVTVAEVRGVASVSLKELVTQLGGDVTIESGTVKISLLGAAANIALDDTRVASTQNEFTIQQPIRAHENDLFISVNDIAPLFSYGFKLTLQAGDAAMTPPPPATSETPLPPLQPIAGRKLRVVIDPGHGGIDFGEGGPSGTQEKNITLAVAQRTAVLLAPVCEPALTREQDVSLTTKERISAANVSVQGDRTVRGDLFISIHTGASTSPTPSGIEVFCPTSPSDVLGQANVQRCLALGRNISAGLAEATGSHSRGVRQIPARIFANLQMPAVLVEVGFISNAKEEELLATPEYQDKLAQGIASGVASYIQEMTR